MCVDATDDNFLRLPSFRVRDLAPRKVNNGKGEHPLPSPPPRVHPGRVSFERNTTLTRLPASHLPHASHTWVTCLQFQVLSEFGKYAMDKALPTRTITAINRKGVDGIEK